MSSRIFGSAIRRREDPRLITGTATYTDDIRLPGLVHAAMLRSPHAHARIRSLDTSKAAEASGVLAVYTGKDTAGVLKPMSSISASVPAAIARICSPFLKTPSTTRM